MSGVEAVAPAVGMLAGFALIAGGIVTFRRGGERRKGVLMLVMAAVLFANVLIWTL